MKKKFLHLFSILIVLCFTLSSCSHYDVPDWEIYVDEWNNFRGTAENLAVTSSKTPKSKKDTALQWTFNTGSRPAGIILAEECIVTFSGNTLYKINSEDGTLINSVQMSGQSKYSSVSPVYYNGVIYVSLDNGIIQAFDFQSLSSLWIYKNHLGGQALSPILCNGEYICTGFWNGETEDADFICLDMAGNEILTYTNTGGFYFAGAVSADGYIITSSDNGESPASPDAGSLVMSFEPSSGKLVDSFQISGDGRSSIVYLNGHIYFVSKTGTFYSAAVKNGLFSDIHSIDMGGECTSAPVIYDHYAFAGISSCKILMIDINNMNIISSTDTSGYPQAAMLLSDAYLEGEGNVYIYSACNSLPGGINLIKANVFKGKLTSETLFDAKGYEQFCLSAPICSSTGALYYANDSGHIFSLVKI